MVTAVSKTNPLLALILEMYILLRKTDTVYLVNGVVTITNKYVTNKDVLGPYNNKNMCRTKMRLEE